MCVKFQYSHSKARHFPYFLFQSINNLLFTTFSSQSVSIILVSLSAERECRNKTSGKWLGFLSFQSGTQL